MQPRFSHYHMPAEWVRHQRTFVSWPVQVSMCYPENYDQVTQGYREIIRAIAEFEPVTVLVNPDEAPQVRQAIESGSTSHPAVGLFNIDYLPIAHNDAWIRDNGPTFVVDDQGHLAGINWKFNAWGGKYAPWDLDDQVAPGLLEHDRVDRLDAPLVMEGGSIHVDGQGTLLTTEECLLNPNRNPGLRKSQIEDFLKQYLHVSRIIWLKRGLSGDETDGHVDNIACFAAPGKVLIQVCDDPDDENFAITQENLAILGQATDAAGRKPEIIPIRQPPRAEYKGHRLTMSYLNFYLVNGGLILPVFGGTAEKSDRLAAEVLRMVFPERRLRRIDGLAILSEGGNVHCTTQQMPEVTRI